MKVHSFENAFLAIGGVTLVACIGALVYATFGMGLHLPGPGGRIDPQRAYQTPPFDQLGVKQVAPNAFEAVVVGQMFAFIPPELRVPAGAEVRFIGTSADVIHGFNIEGTRVNMMMIPGQISRATYRFDRPGEYLLICHEYCGSGHHTMSGRIIVEPAVALGSAASPSTDTTTTPPSQTITAYSPHPSTR